MDNKKRPSRGEVWWIQLEPAKIHQTVKSRPCLVISVDQINFGPANVIIVVPIEFENLGLASHIHIDPKNVGIKSTGYIHCEDIRLIPMSQVQAYAGFLSEEKLEEVEETLSLMLGLS